MDKSFGQEHIGNTMLVGQLAHEIKNPLSTIKVNLQLANEAIEEFVNSGSDKVFVGKDEPRLARALRKIWVFRLCCT